MTRIIIGLFDTRGDAERLAAHLIEQLSTPPGQVQIHGSAAEATEAPPSLQGLPLPQSDYEIYREGIRRGGILVAARVREEAADHAADAFEQHGAVDLEAREADWRAAGWARQPNQTGFTGHDEDIGYATYGGDAVIGHIPRHHHDDTPAGLLGRWEMGAMEADPARKRARVRTYEPANTSG